MFLWQEGIKWVKVHKWCFFPRPWEIYCFRIIAEQLVFDFVSERQHSLEVIVYGASHQRSKMTNYFVLELIIIHCMFGLCYQLPLNCPDSPEGNFLGMDGVTAPCPSSLSPSRENYQRKGLKTSCTLNIVFLAAIMLPRGFQPAGQRKADLQCSKWGTKV